MLDDAQKADLAASLRAAQGEGPWAELPSARHPNLTREEARAVQQLLVSADHRTVVGHALVWPAKGTGVSQLCLATLTAPMRLDEDVPVAGHAGRTQVWVLPYLAALLGRDLQAPSSPPEAMLAVEALCPALVVFRSPYPGSSVPTSLDVEAANGFLTAFVVGVGARPSEAWDPSNLGVVLEVDGRVHKVASSAAVAAHPARALARAAALRAEHAGRLAAGELVLLGSATSPTAPMSGSALCLQIEHLGSVSLRLS